MKKTTLFILLALTTSFLFAEGGAYRYIKEGKWGVINEKGEVIVEPDWDMIYNFRHGITVGRRGSFEDGERFFIDSAGNILNETSFDRAYHFVNGFGTVQIDGLWHYVNKEGQLLNDRGFQRVQDFSGGLGVFTRQSDDGRKTYGALNAGGEVVIQPSSRSLYSFGDGDRGIFRSGDSFGILRKDGFLISDGFSNYRNINADKTLYINYKKDLVDISTGETVLYARTHAAEKLRWMTADLLMFTNKQGKWGLMNTKGEVIILNSYDRIGKAWNGPDNLLVAGIKTPGGYKYALLDKNGRTITAPLFKSLSYFSDDRCFYNRDGLWGLMDLNGKELTEPLFKRVRSFSEDLAAVQNPEGKWTYIHKDGTAIGEALYDAAYDFSQGLAVVRRGDRETGKRIYIDTKGNQAIPLELDWAYSFDKNGVAAVGEGDFDTGRFGYIDKNGSYILEPVH